MTGSQRQSDHFSSLKGAGALYCPPKDQEQMDVMPTGQARCGMGAEGDTAAGPAIPGREKPGRGTHEGGAQSSMEWTQCKVQPTPRRSRALVGSPLEQLLFFPALAKR